MLLMSGLLWALVVGALAKAKAKPQVIIVDDQYGDFSNGVLPTYSEPFTGNTWHEGATCTICSTTPKINTTNGHIMNGTWHDATGGNAGTYSMDFSFAGE